MTNQFIFQAVITVLMLTLLEMLLSVDNIVVISKIANKAGPKDRDKVVKWGIAGAFIFRGLSLSLVSLLLTNPDIGNWGKLLGGFYLIRLAYKEWTEEKDSLEEGDVSWVESLFSKLSINGLLLIILECELIDLVFSVDQIFSTVAFTENIPGTLSIFGLFTMNWSLFLTIIGVFLGIIALRFVTVFFMKLIDKYPSLNTSALIVIAILGIKLVLGSGLELTGFLPSLSEILENHTTDFVLSGVMLLIFFFPIIKGKFFTSDPQLSKFH